MKHKSVKELTELKLSQLLMVAIGDLVEAYNTPGKHINMGVWGVPRGNGCAACFAGHCLMSTGMPIDKLRLGWDEFNDDEGRIADALNECRQFDLVRAANYWYSQKSPKIRAQKMADNYLNYLDMDDLDMDDLGRKNALQVVSSEFKVARWHEKYKPNKGEFYEFINLMLIAVEILKEYNL